MTDAPTPPLHAAAADGHPRRTQEASAEGSPRTDGSGTVRILPHHRPGLEAIRRLYAAAPLRRPIQDAERIKAMFDASNLVHSAWDGPRLVGLLRGWTDGAFDGYVCDLAVHPAYQMRGIGKDLLALLAGEFPQVRWVLLASPLARQYYGRVGWESLDNAWALARTGESLPTYEEYGARFSHLAAQA